MRSASSGISRTRPNAIRTMIASERAAPLARPTPWTSWARATIAIVNVSASPTTIPIGRRRPPIALADSKAGTTGSTHGVIAVPAPAMNANSISSSICAADDGQESLRSC